MTKPFDSLVDLQQWCYQLILSGCKQPYGVVCSEKFFDEYDKAKKSLDRDAPWTSPDIIAVYPVNQTIFCYREKPTHEC